MPIPSYMVELLCHNVDYATSASLCKTRRYTSPLLPVGAPNALEPPSAPSQNSRIGWDTHEEGLKHALHRVFDNFGWSEYQNN